MGQSPSNMRMLSPRSTTPDTLPFECSIVATSTHWQWESLGAAHPYSHRASPLLASTLPTSWPAQQKRPRKMGRSSERPAPNRHAPHPARLSSDPTAVQAEVERRMAHHLGKRSGVMRRKGFTGPVQGALDSHHVASDVATKCGTCMQRLTNHWRDKEQKSTTGSIPALYPNKFSLARFIVILFLTYFADPPFVWRRARQPLPLLHGPNPPLKGSQV